MKPTKKMLATQFANNILVHLTNSAIAVRNSLEDGDPVNGIGAADVEDILGKEQTEVILEVLELCIDEESEKQRVEQRKKRDV